MPGVGTTVAERVIQKVATTTNSDALELPPLYDAIDPDALDALVEEMSAGKVSFPYAGHEVTIRSDGTISLGQRPTGHPTADIAVSDD